MVAKIRSQNAVDIKTAVRELDKASMDVVAEVLHAAEIKGWRRDSCKCPIAEYLSERTEHHVHVGKEYARDKDTEDDNGLGGTRVALPNAVRGFITQFDRGQFIELREERDL